MSKVDNDQIYDLLCRIHTDIGELKATGTGTRAWLVQHIEDDKAMAANIKTLELANATTQGRTKTWGLIATAAGVVASGVSAAAAFIKLH